MIEGSSQPDLKLYDINRVEVLHGPLGTLFGSGSLVVRLKDYHTDSHALEDALRLSRAGEIPADRGVPFGPDCVLNAGGIISGMQALNTILGREKGMVRPLDENLATIYDRMLQMFAYAETVGKTPEAAAEEMGREIIGHTG